MAEIKDIPVTSMYFEQEGDSFYSNKNQMTFIIYNRLLQFIQEYRLEESVLKKDSVRIVDYGTSDGIGFASILPHLIGLFQIELQNCKNLNIIFNDRPENDFKAVQYTFEGLQKQLSCDNNVEMSTCAQSFYNSCQPESSVFLAVCAIAVHWLSQQVMVTSDTDNELIYSTLVKEQADKDFSTFLLNRSHELMKGGYVLLSILGESQSGNITFSKKTCDGTQPIRKTLMDIFRQLESQGIITREETTMPYIVYYRTVQDICKPFDTDNSEVTKAGLSLVKIETEEICTPNYQNYIQSKQSAKDFAEREMNVWKSICYNIVYNNLSPERTHQQRENICEQFFQLLRVHFEEFADDFDMSYVVHNVLLRKQ